VLAATAPTSLTRATLLQGIRALSARDAGLAAIVARHGPPPMWARPRGFATLARIILEQQVSLASAAAMFARLERELDGVTPAAVRVAGAAGLQALGVTRQKAGYITALAGRVADGSLPLATLARLPDAEAALVARPVGVRRIDHPPGRIHRDRHR